MRRMVRPGLAVVLLAVVLVGAVARSASAQDDPALGNWRGTMKTADGTSTPFIITIVTNEGGYAGTTSGFSEAIREVSLDRVTVDGNKVSVAASADSRLGQVSFSSELTIDGATMQGAGTVGIGTRNFPVTLELQRRARRDVVQPTVEQRIEYFLGRWRFDYTGGEFLPLSAGSRNGVVAFTRVGASTFATGQVEGELDGKPYRESLSLGFDPTTDTIVMREHHADGVELLSLGNWQSPLAIRFVTAPVTAEGRTFQLKRVLSVHNDKSFDITEEFSVDGGPFRRLGNARFTKEP